MNVRDLKIYLFNNQCKIVDIVEHLNFHNVDDSNSSYISMAVPDGDNPQSVIQYVDRDYLNCTCYTRNIHIKDAPSSTDFICLVGYALGLSYLSSKQWIINYLGLGDNKSVFKRDNLLFFRKFMKKNNKQAEQIHYPISIIDKYEKIMHIDLIKNDSLINEDICMDKYFVRYDQSSQRIVFPHLHWKDGDIVGLVGRTTNPNYKELNIRKYMSLLSTKYIKTDNLYGLYQNIDYIKINNEIIIFEAEKSVQKLDVFKLPPIGCSVGCHSISDEQKKIILSLGVNNITIAFDTDVTDVELFKACDMFYDYMNVYFVKDKWSLLNEKCSPVDKGLKKWNFMYKHRTKYERFMLNNANKEIAEE